MFARSCRVCLTLFKPRKSFSTLRTISLLPGDGVGPELMDTVRQVASKASVPISFEEVQISEVNDFKDAEYDLVLKSIRENKVVLKGIIDNPNPLRTRVTGQPTLNMRLRRELDLYAQVVHVKSLKGVATRHENVDFIIVREQTEGEYTALEHEPVPGVVESLKVITRDKSMRIARFAFDYAMKHGRQKVTAVHKANIMKSTDGLFLQCCRDVAADYPKVELVSMIVDNTCMQLVSNPWQFDVMVMPNLYGSIVSNVSAGLVGGAGVVAGEGHSDQVAVFEPGARHTFDIAKGRNMANPTAILLSFCNLLSYVDLAAYADRIQTALLALVAEAKYRTVDLGGVTSTHEFTDELCRRLSFTQ